VLESCVARAEGNPLFLEQLLRHVAETGSGDVPGTVRNVVLARLDRLSPADHRAALTASVIGQRFGLRLLRRMLREDDYSPAGLLASGLVRAIGEDYLFAHALVHEGAYASLLHSAARELHRDAADYYAPIDRILRAQHLDRAADDRAALAFCDAADAEAQSFRFARALELAARGLQLCTRTLDRVALRLLQGRILHDSGDIQPSMQAYQAALAEAGDDVQQCRAWIGLAAVMRLSDDLDGAFDALRHAEPLAQAHALWLELAEVHYLRGSLHFPRGELAECLESHGRALELARRAGSPYEEARAMSGLADAHYASGRIRTAYTLFTDCIDLCRAHGFGRIEASNLFMVATVRLYLNELDQALQDALRSIDIAHRVGHQRAEIVSRLVAAWIYLLQSRPDAAEVHADAGLLLAERLGARRFRAFLLESVARILLARADRSGAQAAIQEALDIARSVEVMRFIGPWLLGTSALVSTDAVQSHAALAEGLALLDTGCVGHNYYWFYKHAMESCLDHDDAAGAVSYAARLEAYTASEPTPWSDLFIRRARLLSAPAGAAAAAEARAVLLLAREAGHAQAQVRLEIVAQSA
jgi:tetratricopeptide (TPR) repeat protein